MSESWRHEGVHYAKTRNWSRRLQELRSGTSIAGRGLLPHMLRQRGRATKMSDGLNTLKCHCDHCSQKLEFPADALGMEIKCPTCHQETTLRGPRHIPLPPLATLANGQRVSEDITEVMVKPRRPGIISLPLYTIAGFLRPYPRFYQIVGFFFILIGGFGYVARRISGGKSLDDPPFYAYVIGGIVVLVCATIARQQKAEEEAITKPRRDREKEKVEALLRRIQENPFKCPKCGSSEVVKHHPSKPVVFSPMTFTGILTGGIANAMADKIFRPEVVCQSCGCRWEMPD